MSNLEEVEKINPNLILCDPTAKAYTVRDEAVNATLVEKLIQHPVLMSMFLAVFVSRESAGGG